LIKSLWHFLLQAVINYGASWYVSALAMAFSPIGLNSGIEAFVIIILLFSQS
jgi:hypothetical protein